MVQDIAGANKLLDDAGITDTDGDGVREKDGVPLKVLYQTSTNSVRQGAQALIKQWWSEIGVETELRNISASVFFGGDPSSPDTFQKFYADIEMYTNNFAGVDPEAYMASWICSDMPQPDSQWQGNNIMRWCNPEYDALVKQALDHRTARGARRDRQAAERHADAVLRDHPADPPWRRLGACQHARRRQDLGLGFRALEHRRLAPRQVNRAGGCDARRSPPAVPSAPCGGGLGRGDPVLRYTIRRLMFAVPTLLVISFIIFALLDLAPSDPTASLPLTIPPEVRAQIRASLGLDEPFHIRYLYWLNQFFVNEPLNIIEQWFGVTIGDGDRLRVISWSTRSPVVDLIVERMPQTLWVVGTAYLVAIAIAIPIGVISAYKQYSWFDQAGTFVSMVGFSVPPFFTGLVVIVIFSVNLGWFPSIYDTTHRVVDWNSFVVPGPADDHAGDGAGAADQRQPRSPGICAPPCWTTSIRTMSAPPGPRG